MDKVIDFAVSVFRVFFGKSAREQEQIRLRMQEFHTERCECAVTTSRGWWFRIQVTCSFEKLDGTHPKQMSMVPKHHRIAFAENVCICYVREKFTTAPFCVRYSFKGGWREPFLEYRHGYGGEEAAPYADLIPGMIVAPDYQVWGWAVRSFSRLNIIGPNEDEIIANYKLLRVITDNDMSEIENSPEYLEREENIMIALAYRALTLEKEMNSAHADQSVRGDHFSITSKGAGRTAALTWAFKRSPEPQHFLLGFRREGGFSQLSDQGLCVVDTRTDGTAVQSLKPGVDYYYSFELRNKSTPGAEPLETLRFSVRLPTDVELQKRDAFLVDLIRKAQGTLADQEAARVKREAVAQEVINFVDFEETMDAVEKDMIERVRSKNYSFDETEEKIARIKDYIGHLKLRNS